MIPNNDRVVTYNNNPPLPDEIWSDIIQFVGPVNKITNQQIAAVCKHLLAIWRSGVKAIHITLNNHRKFSVVRDYPFDKFPKLRRTRLSELGYDNDFEVQRNAMRPNTHPHELHIELEFSTGKSMQETADILARFPDLANLVTSLSINMIAPLMDDNISHFLDDSASNNSNSDDPASEESDPDEEDSSNPYNFTHKGKIWVNSELCPTIADVVAVARQLPSLTSLWIKNFARPYGITNEELVQLLSLEMRHHLWINLNMAVISKIGLDALSNSELTSLDLTCGYCVCGPQVLDAISKMPCLERLILEGWDLNEEYDESLNGWKNLKHLTIKNCYNIEKIFSAFNGQLEELESLEIWYDEILATDYLAQFGELPKLKHITLTNTNAKDSARIDRKVLRERLLQLPCVEEVTIYERPHLLYKEEDEYVNNAMGRQVRVRYEIIF